MNDYVKIEIKNPTIITSDKSDIELIVSFLNSVDCKKNIFEDDTLKSPEVMIHLIKADNSYDTITVWGGAYKADTYIHYNNTQYKLNSREDFYKQFDEIKTGIQTQLN